MIFGFFKKKGAKASKAGQKEVVEGEVIGAITHYFSHSKAGVLKLKGSLNAGDTIRIKGHTTDFKQKIDSMQIDGTAVTSASKGKEIGLLVKKRVRVHDTVYKLN